LYDKYNDRGFAVLGFPCNQFANQEPLNNGEIQQFCQLNYNVSFPVFGKIDVKGPQADPLYRHLTKEAPGLFGQSIKWNFTKFLIDRQGNIIKRFAPSVKPESLESAIVKLL